MASQQENRGLISTADSFSVVSVCSLCAAAVHKIIYLLIYKGTPGWGLSVWSLHVLPVYAWVLSGYSGFPPPSKNMHVRLTGDSRIVLMNECERMCGCLSLCGPVMDWRSVQGVPRLSRDDRWDRLQPPRDPTDG